MSEKILRTAYFDCFSGISGDMILGALVDLGVDLKQIRKGLESLDLKGFRLQSRRVKRGLISGTRVNVVVEKKGRAHPHSRSFSDIKKLIQRSKLPATVQTRSIEIFKRIARAEGKIHHTSMEKVHFHEVGAVDSIVDIVGGAFGIELLKVDRIFSSPLNTGEGSVKCEHGVLPVPAPATLELLKGIPCFSTGVRKELTTPTGAAMIGFLASEFRSFPEMKIIGTGYGAGEHRVDALPNMLRIILGEMRRGESADRMVVVETNIDDMNPEFYDHVMESLFQAGAVDVFFTPIIMKKNRPAVKVSALVPESVKDKTAHILLSETSTFGVRSHAVDRVTLDREVRSLETPYGSVSVKIGRLAGTILQVAPEYDDCKKIARREKLPLKKIYEDVLRLGKQKWGRKGRGG